MTPPFAGSNPAMAVSYSPIGIDHFVRFWSIKNTLADEKNKVPWDIEANAVIEVLSGNKAGNTTYLSVVSSRLLVLLNMED